jgi:PTS system trehalose-specific IIC component
MDLEAVIAAGKATDIVTVITNADRVAGLTVTLGEATAKTSIGRAEILS